MNEKTSNMMALHCTLLFYLGFISLLGLTFASPFRSASFGRNPPGMPDDMTREEFLETRGQGRRKQENIRKIAQNIKRHFLKEGQVLPENVDDKFDDLVFTEDQLKLIEQAISSPRNPLKTTHRRQKRKVADFSNPSAPFNDWLTTTIYFVFDGSHTLDQQTQIKAAMAHWAEKTCLRFVEGPDNVADFPYIYITRNESDGCWSFIGRVADVGPQILNLASDCFMTDGRTGTIIHELGHAIGFVHEHTRDDRDVYVKINEANIISGLESQFALWPTGWLNPVIMNKAKYDLSSIMHYSPKAFSSNSDYTIIANNPLYGGNMGQRRYLTFWDAFAANQQYCSDVCPSPITCQRGGYQDPNNCDVCICPSGFTGQYCEQDEANTAVCPSSGHIDIGSDPLCLDIRVDIASSDALKCDWHIQAASGCKIDFWFESLNLACSTYDKSCYDYVEVRYRSELQVRGPRFCCSAVPDGINGTLGQYQTTETNEMVVNLASFYISQGYMPSFKLCLRVSDMQCMTDTTPSTTTSTPTTTTSTTPTTTPTTTSTTTTSTTPTTTPTTTTSSSTTTTSTTPTTTPTTTTSSSTTTTSTTTTTKASTTTSKSTATTATKSSTTTSATTSPDGSSSTKTGIQTTVSTTRRERPTAKPVRTRPPRPGSRWSRWNRPDNSRDSDRSASTDRGRYTGNKDFSSKSQDKDVLSGRWQSRRRRPWRD